MEKHNDRNRVLGAAAFMEVSDRVGKDEHRIDGVTDGNSLRNHGVSETRSCNRVLPERSEDFPLHLLREKEGKESFTYKTLCSEKGLSLGENFNKSSDWWSSPRM